MTTAIDALKTELAEVNKLLAPDLSQLKAKRRALMKALEALGADMDDAGGSVDNSPMLGPWKEITTEILGELDGPQNKAQIKKLVVERIKVDFPEIKGIDTRHPVLVIAVNDVVRAGTKRLGGDGTIKESGKAPGYLYIAAEKKAKNRRSSSRADAA